MGDTDAFPFPRTLQIILLCIMPVIVHAVTGGLAYGCSSDVLVFTLLAPVGCLLFMQDGHDASGLSITPTGGSFLAKNKGRCFLTLLL